jgi:hypothetical protein
MGDEREIVIREWSRQWDGFCRWIVDEYGLILKDWLPAESQSWLLSTILYIVNW